VPNILLLGNHEELLVALQLQPFFCPDLKQQIPITTATASKLGISCVAWKRLMRFFVKRTMTASDSSGCYVHRRTGRKPVLDFTQLTSLHVFVEYSTCICTSKCFLFRSCRKIPIKTRNVIERNIVGEKTCRKVVKNKKFQWLGKHAN